MSGWETAGAKKKAPKKKGQGKEMPTLAKAAPIEDQPTMYALFNDVEAEKKKKAERRAKEAKKKAGRVIVSDFDATAPAVTNFEKQQLAKHEAKKKKSKAKKTAVSFGEPSGSGAPSRTIEQVVAGWDTPELVAKLDEIEESYSAETQEHVMVLMIAEYLEEKFAGVVGDWAELLGEGDGSFAMGAEAAAAPVAALPNKSCDAIVKALRRRSRAAKNGLVAFLLSHTWATLSGAKKGGVGVRMLLQLVAQQDAGCVAWNLRMLPIDGMETLRPSAASGSAGGSKQQGSVPTISAIQAADALSPLTTVWVLKQLTNNSSTSRPWVFHGWWNYLLPLMDPSVGGKEAAQLAIDVSLELFANASWEKLSLGPAERKPAKGSGAADWMIAPSALRELLCLEPAGLGREALKGVESLRQAVLRLCRKHGQAAGLFTPALFAQLLPLLAQRGGLAVPESDVVDLLLECLAAGGKTWANWAQSHTSAKATNFESSVALLRALSVSRPAVRGRMDRGKLISTGAHLAAQLAQLRALPLLTQAVRTQWRRFEPFTR